MAEVQFNIAALFEKTFGYKTQAFSPEFKPIVNSGSKSMKSRTEFGVYGSQYYADDALGREYYMPVKLTYPDEAGSANGLITNTDGTQGATTDAPVGVLKDWYLPHLFNTL